MEVYLRNDGIRLIIYERNGKLIAVFTKEDKEEKGNSP